METVGGWLQGLGVIAATIGVLMGIGCMILGVPFVSPYVPVVLAFGWGGTALAIIGSAIG